MLMLTIKSHYKYADIKSFKTKIITPRRSELKYYSVCIV